MAIRLYHLALEMRVQSSELMKTLRGRGVQIPSVMTILDDEKAAQARRVATGDVFPKSVRLGKGEHVLQFQFRHDDVKRLEAVKKMPLLLDRSLGSPVSLSIYPTRPAALAR